MGRGSCGGSGPGGARPGRHVCGAAGAGGGQRRGPEGDADQLHGAAEGHRAVPGEAGRHGGARVAGAAREGPGLWGAREGPKRGLCFVGFSPLFIL